MKTKTFLFVLMLLSFGLFRLSAQTKSVPFRYSSNGGLELPVYCDGVSGEVDRVILGDFTNRGVFHYDNGVAVWVSGSLTGDCTSKKTGEVFTYKETDTRTLLDGTSYVVIFNLKGNMGHHYIGTFIVDFSDGQYILNPVVIKAICNVNGPEKE